MKVLMLNGGGLESLALGITLKQYNHDITSLHVDFGYPSSARNKVAAKLIADTYCNSHIDVSLTGMSHIGWNPVELRYQPVQYQQLILSSLGAAQAQMGGMPLVISGFRHKLLTPEFKNVFTALLGEVRLGGLNPLQLIHPLETISSDDELYEIIKDSSILHDTVSCLSEPACGTCSKCLLREKYNI